MESEEVSVYGLRPKQTYDPALGITAGRLSLKA